MNQVEKPKENKGRAVANSVPQKKSNGKQGFGFVDNRPAAVAQRKLQAMADNYTSQQLQPIQKKENNTGLPDNLKAGMENLSGISLDDVKVHRNSDKPAQLQAYAYVQGTDIHLGPGQEKHLPHEAWHVVQQKQGRVKPTTQMKSEVNVNDDAGLEKEADVMGLKATNVTVNRPFSNLENKSNTNKIVQRYQVTGYSEDNKWQYLKFHNDNKPDQNGEYKGKFGFFYEESLSGGYHTYKRRPPLLGDMDISKDNLTNLITNASSFTELILVQTNFGKTFNSKNKMLEEHTTMGIELEFAKHSMGIGAHDIIATNNKPILPLIGGEWVLEGDDGNKLEIGVPPMLVPMGLKRNQCIVHMYDIFNKEVKQMLVSLDDHTTMQELVNCFYQIGSLGSWTFKDNNYKKGKMSTNNNDVMGIDDTTLTKEENAKSFNTYGQINIAMNIKDAAKTAGKGRKNWNENNTAGGKLDVLKSINGIDITFGNKYRNTIFRQLWSRSVGSLISAIHLSSSSWTGSLVKETDATWIKATVPSKIDLASDADKLNKRTLSKFINDGAKKQTWIKSLNESTTAAEIRTMLDPTEREADIPSLVSNLINATTNKLKSGKDVDLPDDRANRTLKSELGEGVRGDTLLKNNVGTDTDPRVLTEIRSDEAIDKLLRPKH
jgi:hypothetical protein